MSEQKIKKLRGGAHVAHVARTPIKKPAASKPAVAAAPKVEAAKPAAAASAMQKRLPLILGIIGGVLVLLFGLLCAFAYLYPNQFPGVTVGSVKVSGMNLSQTEAAVEEKSGSLFTGQNVSVTIYDKTYDIPVESVVGGIDAQQSAQNAYAVGRTGNVFSRIGQIVGAMFGAGDAQLAATVDDAGLGKQLDDIAAKALTEPVQPTYEIGADTLTIHAGKPGVSFDGETVRAALEEKIRLLDFTPYEVKTELTETPAIDVDKIASEVVGDPVNASVDKTDGKTIIDGKPGVSMDVAEAKKIVGDGSQELYTIPVKTTQPAVMAADLAGVLFRDTLASTSTDINEGNTSRTHNVRLACEAINGTILNPGDSFSYNGIVGERTPERGYQTAGVYANGKVIDDYGGGVCQPSTTLYMAVLRADLEVTERQNHMFTVSYAPMGEDATVDYGSIDFCFRNDTNYPIKILSSQSDGQVYMSIVGTKTSDKSVETRTEVLETYSPSTIEKNDSSMYVGESRVDQTAITGYGSRTYKIITENGQTNEELANTSSYTKRDEIIYVGTKQREAAPSAPSTTEETENTGENTESSESSADPENEDAA